MEKEGGKDIKKLIRLVILDFVLLIIVVFLLPFHGLYPLRQPPSLPPRTWRAPRPLAVFFKSTTCSTT